MTEGISVRELAAREKASGGARRGRRRKVSTEAEITRVLDDFVTWIEEHHPEVTAAEVRRPVIESYVTHLEARFKGSTVRNRVAYIRRMFEYGVERELVERNPCRKIQVAAPTLQEQQRVASNSALTENECDRLLQACREPWETDGSCYHPPAYLYPLVLLLLRTGCRIGELVRTVKKNPATAERDEREGLRWQDIGWDERMIRIDGKTGPRRVPVIADDALDALHEFQALTGRTSGPVFTNNGDPVGRPSKSFTAAVKRAGITRRVRFHDLRHTVGTLLEKKGVRQRTIQVQLGHSSHVTTQKYVHSDARSARDEVRRAVGESGA